MSPIVTTIISDTRDALAAARTEGRSIGLVPTMGALHEGPASLLRAARQEHGFVVATIFVNPAQFGPKEDLSRYPRPFENDVEVCRREGVDLIFAPMPSVLYPSGFNTWVEVHGLQDVLEGASRPGHFRGVATVVLKLFNIVQPDAAYFGQKDAQQVCVLQKMVRDLDVPVRLKICPTVREADGLALSSRNQYLTPEQRQQATILHRVLQAVRQHIEAGEREPQTLVRLAQEMVQKTPEARLDYIALVDGQTLKPLERLAGQALIPLAIYLGTTRLIDNILVEVDN